MIALFNGLAPKQHELKATPASCQREVIETIHINPNDQPHIWLGSYLTNQSPRGFAVTVTPQSSSEDVITQVVTIQTANDSYDLVMNIANYSATSITAQIEKI